MRCLRRDARRRFAVGIGTKATPISDRVVTLMKLTVECYAGYRGEETPVRFQLGGGSVEVMEVIDRWLAPDHQYFKVRAADDIYILRNEVTTGDWELTSF